MLLKRLELPLRVDPNLMLYNVFARRVRELHLHPKKYIIGIFGKYMEKYTVPCNLYLRIHICRYVKRY
jgi:hypothetical protein